MHTYERLMRTFCLVVIMFIMDKNLGIPGDYFQPSITNTESIIQDDSCKKNLVKGC